MDVCMTLDHFAGARAAVFSRYGVQAGDSGSGSVVPDSAGVL